MYQAMDFKRKLDIEYFFLIGFRLVFGLTLSKMNECCNTQASYKHHNDA